LRSDAGIDNMKKWTGKIPKMAATLASLKNKNNKAWFMSLCNLQGLECRN